MDKNGTPPEDDKIIQLSERRESAITALLTLTEQGSGILKKTLRTFLDQLITIQDIREDNVRTKNELEVRTRLMTCVREQLESRMLALATEHEDDPASLENRSRVENLEALYAHLIGYHLLLVQQISSRIGVRTVMTEEFGTAYQRHPYAVGLSRFVTETDTESTDLFLPDISMLGNFIKFTNRSIQMLGFQKEAARGRHETRAMYEIQQQIEELRGVLQQFISELLEKLTEYICEREHENLDSEQAFKFLQDTVTLLGSLEIFLFHELLPCKQHFDTCNARLGKLYARWQGDETLASEFEQCWSRFDPDTVLACMDALQDGLVSMTELRENERFRAYVDRKDRHVALAEINGLLYLTFASALPQGDEFERLEPGEYRCDRRVHTVQK